MSLSHKDDEEDFFSADEGSRGGDSDDQMSDHSAEFESYKIVEKFSIESMPDRLESKRPEAGTLALVPDNLTVLDIPSKVDEEDWIQFPENLESDIPSAIEEDKTKDEESSTETTVDNDQYRKKSSSWFSDWNSILSNASRLGTSVLETVESTLGAPSPEELAKITSKNDQKVSSKFEEPESTHQDDQKTDLGGLLHNVTHLVGNTGRTILSSSLDVMENIGKTSFNVLTEPSTSSENDSRRKFRFQPSDQPNLSQILREARQKPEVEPAGWAWDDEKVDTESDGANLKSKIPKFDDYFEKCNGNVHLDALKMFSESQDMQINSILESLTAGKRRILNLKMKKLIAKFDEVLSDENSKTDEEFEGFITVFNQLWPKLGLKGYKCDRLMDIYRKHDGIMSNLDDEEDCMIVMQKSVEFFGEFASAVVEIFLKIGQLLIVDKRPPEIICLAKLTKLIVHEVNEKTTGYSILLEKCSQKIDNDVGVNLLTDLFVEATNCSICVKESSKLLIPIMKILFFESSFPCTD